MGWRFSWLKGVGELRKALVIALALVVLTGGVVCPDFTLTVDAKTDEGNQPLTVFGHDIAWVHEGSALWNVKSDSLKPSAQAVLETTPSSGLIRFPTVNALDAQNDYAYLQQHGENRISIRSRNLRSNEYTCKNGSATTFQDFPVGSIIVFEVTMGGK